MTYFPDTREGSFVTITSQLGLENERVAIAGGGISLTDLGSQLVIGNTASGNIAPADATYLTLTANSTLTNERVLTSGDGTDFVDTGANGTLTISIPGNFEGVQTVAINTLLSLTKITLVDATTGIVTISLPPVSGLSNRIYVIKKVDSSNNNVVIDANGSETIDGATTFSLKKQYDSITIVCDGTQWFII